jgi:exonuclease SbcC
MIPISLRVSGFLSYREAVDLDFTAFELACISGANGAGKSSLLDAITWALFGQARKRDDSVINSHPGVAAAEVTFIFAYEGNYYRVQRTAPRGKSTLLEFHISQNNQAADLTGTWKALSERTLRETQARIEQTLRMNYETFVNASFFLQGKADQFTQQRPGDRKRILGSILGLEVWEEYRERAVERRKSVENQVSAVQGRLGEIHAELSQEPARKERLSRLERELDQLGRLRQEQQALLESARKTAASLAEQRRLVETLARQAQIAIRRRDEARQKLTSRQQEQELYSSLLARAEQIAAQHAAWEDARQEAQRWQALEEKYRVIEAQRQAPLAEILAARSKLEQERVTLDQRQVDKQKQAQLLLSLERQMEQIRQTLGLAETQVVERTELEQALQEARQHPSEAQAENQRLMTEMNEIKAHLEQLEQAGAVCPFCGQALDEADRQALLDSLTAQGKEKGDLYRQNRLVLERAVQVVQDLEIRYKALSSAQASYLAQARQMEQLSAQIAQAQERLSAWEQEGAPRLAEVDQMLSTESFCGEARQRLAELNEAQAAIGYDPAAHQAARQMEQAGRGIEAELRELEKGRASQAALEREIGDLIGQLSGLDAEAAQHETEHLNAAAILAAAEAQTPDLVALEREFFDTQERENRLRLEVGAARQDVDVLDSLRQRQKILQAEQESLNGLVAQYKQLERAFSRDGVPALLIEQALPEIEERANLVLDRLSAGGMSVRFITQAEYKDKRRDDRKETLDIQISDENGSRDYEMYSGGEAFRVNFAVRLALSEVLAQRAGARLQMLVIDEGFGSQDAQGRQRLIEAINMVRQDFAKILVITHIDELKDAFPNRVEVEKSPEGSWLRVV